MHDPTRKKKKEQADGKDISNLGLGPSTLYYSSLVVVVQIYK